MTQAVKARNIKLHDAPQQLGISLGHVQTLLLVANAGTVKITAYSSSDNVGDAAGNSIDAFLFPAGEFQLLRICRGPRHCN